MLLIRQALALITGSPNVKRPLKGLTERQLIELESQIGGQLFGPVPAGHRRDFFCLDEHTWVWHEEWKDVNGKRQVSTTRYEVQPKGILKIQSGRTYKYIEGEELENLAIAVRMYFEQTMREVYKLDPTTGQPLTATPPATI